MVIYPKNSPLEKEALFVLYDLWPVAIELPVSFEVLRSSWCLLNEGTEREAPDYDKGPLAMILMPNGATMKIEQIDPYEPRSRGEELRGNWGEYTGGDGNVEDELSDILSAVFVLVTPKFDQKEEG